MKKLSLPVLAGSIREGRQSLQVAKQILAEFKKDEALAPRLLDLAEASLPLLTQKPDESKPQPAEIAEFTIVAKSAAGICIVAPEYKNGIPGALKNALDLLPPQALRRKPVAICTVSAGGFGGILCLSQLRQVVLALGGVPIPDFLAVSQVQEQQPGDLSEKISKFVAEFRWYLSALQSSAQPST